jgi:hypothetical protein
VTLFDYEASRRIAQLDAPFHAMIMAAYRRADTINQALLEQAFPATCREVRLRYNAPGGRLPEEQQVSS